MTENNRPLYPAHGKEYKDAIAEAIKEYQTWENERLLHKGIHVYSRKTPEENP